MIAYYVSAHGYGHGVRASAIVRALNQAYPNVPITIISALPEAFLSNRLTKQAPVSFRSAQFDLGMVQLDSIRVDVPATLREISKIYAGRDETVVREVDYLREQEVRVVVTDIPAMPLEAASKAGIPGIAVGNFAWNWIYSDFLDQDERWQAIIHALEEGYRTCSLLLKLPFSEPMSVFPVKEEVPLLASCGDNRRDAMAKHTGADPAKRWLLLSFTALNWSDRALASVRALDEYEFFTVKPLDWQGGNIHAIDRADVAFSDVLASVEAVISKPGFGILSECVVNKKPLIYAEREDFVEYPILEEAIQRYLRHVHVPAEKLYAGDLRDALDAIWRTPDVADTLPNGGDAIAAQRIHDFIK